MNRYLIQGRTEVEEIEAQNEIQRDSAEREGYGKAFFTDGQANSIHICC